MNSRQAKKLRQLARRALRAEGLTRAQLAERFRLQIRPAPWWFPDRLWIWLAQCFLVPRELA